MIGSRRRSEVLRPRGMCDQSTWRYLGTWVPWVSQRKTLGRTVGDRKSPGTEGNMRLGGRQLVVLLLGGRVPGTHRNDRRGIRDSRGTRWGPSLNHDPSAVKASISTISRARRTQLWTTGLAGVLVREGVVGYITAPGEEEGGGRGIWASGHLGKVSGFGGAIWFHWASLARSVPFSVKPGWPIAEESLVGAQLGAEALGRPDLAAALPGRQSGEGEGERERRRRDERRGEVREERKEAERRGRVGEWEREGGTGRVSRWGCYW
ncbi:hypothetical protein OIDMADRAFT_57146 [Oidiodendron maius Zn]|uniref:Uncharacterized protein n=1 Tax=Oidiodendron maius (strain Zn) TaxID=913774 RepID=A0A0C3H2N3_OIDMZ|nr:hypothetical protein OIDMADRAFT_57146 [Oidiodendron maius Zn]